MLRGYASHRRANYHMHKGHYSPTLDAITRKPRLIPTATQAFDKWKHFVGIENDRGEKLTESMLRAWSNNSNRELECTFDGEHFPSNYWYCTHCKEYKGLQPYIPSWSNWG